MLRFFMRARPDGDGAGAAQQAAPAAADAKAEQKAEAASPSPPASPYDEVKASFQKELDEARADAARAREALAAREAADAERTRIEDTIRLSADANARAAAQYAPQMQRRGVYEPPPEDADPGADQQQAADPRVLAEIRRLREATERHENLLRGTAVEIMDQKRHNMISAALAEPKNQTVSRRALASEVKVFGYEKGRLPTADEIGAMAATLREEATQTAAASWERHVDVQRKATAAAGVPGGGAGAPMAKPASDMSEEELTLEMLKQTMGVEGRA